MNPAAATLAFPASAPSPGKTTVKGILHLLENKRIRISFKRKVILLSGNLVWAGFRRDLKSSNVLLAKGGLQTASVSRHSMSCDSVGSAHQLLQLCCPGVQKESTSHSLMLDKAM